MADNERFYPPSPLMSEETVNSIQNSDKERLMTGYLLGELTGSEQSLVEESIFANDDYFAELLAVEDDLISKYLSGELSPAELEGFNLHFLSSPKRCERVDMARTLEQTIKNRSIKSNPESIAQRTNPNKPDRFFAQIFITKFVRRAALAAAALIIVCGASWLVWQRLELRKEVTRLEQESALLRQQKEEIDRQTDASQERDQQLTEKLQTEQLRRSESEEQTIELQRENERLKQPKINPEQTPVSVITFLLTPGLVRDVGGEKILRLPRGTRTVILNLNLNKDEYPNYQISLQTAEGREVWRRDNLKARHQRSGPTLAFPVPARLLPAGVYILILNGKTATVQTDLINQYAFNVVIK